MIGRLLSMLSGGLTESPGQLRRSSGFPILFSAIFLFVMAASFSACGEIEVDITGSAGTMVGDVYEDSIVSQAVSATAGEGSVAVSWAAVKGAASYNIYWSTSSGVTTAYSTKIEGAVSPYSHTSLSVAGDATYYYAVTAVVPTGEGGLSSEVSATPSVDSSVVPSGVSAAGGAGDVTISWTAVTGADSYNIYWGTSAGVTVSSGTKINGAVSPDTVSLSAGDDKHYFIVTSVSSRGESVGSTEVSATPAIWKTLSSMTIARSYPVSSVVDGKIYVIGGADYDNDTSTYNTSYDEVEEYDPSTDTWTLKTSMTNFRSHLISETVNGKIYAIGGLFYNFVTSWNEEYDPATDTWSSVTSMSTLRYAFCSAVVDGKIYAIGGIDTSSFLSSVEEYDPAADSWTPKASMSTARSYFTCSAVNGKIYAIGGWDGTDVLKTVEEYDPATNTWSTKTSLPFTRSDTASAIVDGKIYVFGGWSGSLYMSQVWEYDPVADDWSTKTSMPAKRSDTASAVVDGKIYLIGGWDGTGITSTVEVYAPSAD
jgi:N-acetylneuraminic acid mutarotase